MEKSLEEYIVDSNVVLAELNKRLESSQFLVGDQYTIADTMVAIWMQWALWNNSIENEIHPISLKTLEWFSVVSNRAGFQETYDRKGHKWVVHQF